MLWLPVLLGAGVASFFALRADPAPWVGPAALAACIAAWAWRRAPLAAAGLAVALGFSAAQWAAWRAPPVVALPGRAVTLAGRVAAVDMLAEGRRLVIAGAVLAPGLPPLDRKLRVRLRNTDTTAVAEGDAIRIRTLLRPPAPPAFPGAWDLQRDAFFGGLAGGGYALGPVEVLAHTPPSGLAALVARLRGTVQRRILAGLPGAAGGIAATLLAGDAGAVPEQDRAAFRESGLAHLLAVAGLHIGIVMGLVFGAVRLGLAAWEYAALHWPTRQLSAIAAWAAGGLYLVLTGAHVPIQRSFAMACLVTLGLVLGRRALSLRALGLAATVLLLATPQAIVGVSFQMSFSAVLALISGYEALRPWLARLGGERWWRRLVLHVVMLALTSLLAGAASAPYGAYHFGQVQLYFVLSNLLAVPLTALWVMPWGLAVLALMPLGLQQVALAPMGWGITGLLAIAHGTAALPAASLPLPHMPFWGLLAVSAGLAWLGIWRSRLRLAGVPVILLGLASPWMAAPPDVLVSADGRLIGVRLADGVALKRGSGASDFTASAWRQLWGDWRDAPPPCSGAACVLHPRPGTPALALLPDGTAPDGCGDAVVAVSPVPLRATCAALARIDRFSVWRDGAAAVWLRPAGAVLVTDRDLRGARAWVPEGGIEGARAPALPTARAE